MAITRFRQNTQTKSATMMIGWSRAMASLILFLVPLFFIPGLTDVVELPKATLFLFLVALVATFWALGMVLRGQLVWRTIPAWPAITLAGLSILLSTIWSTAPQVSFFGLSGYVHNTAPVLLAGLVFFVLAIQIFDREHDSYHVTMIVLAALGLTGLQALLQSAGVSPLTLPSLQSRQFFIAGNTVAAFSAVMAVLVLFSSGIWFTVRGLIWKILVGVAGGIGLLVLLSIDATAGWVTLLVGAVVYLIVLSTKPLSRAVVIMTGSIAAIALVGLLVPTSGAIQSHIVQDASLDAKTTWSVVRSSIGQMPILGSGPSTFLYDFSMHRPASFNQTVLAAYSFVKGSDEAMTLLASLGILGAGALLVALAWLAVTYIRTLDLSAKVPTKTHESRSLLFAAFVALGTAGFFAPGSMTSFVVMIALAALTTIHIEQSRERAIPSGIGRSISTLLFLGGVLSVVITAVWPIRMILADRQLVNVSTAVKRTEDLNLVINKIDRAIRLTPNNPLPYFYRAQAHLIQGQLLVAQSKESEATPVFSAALQDAQLGVAKDPKNAVLYSTLGSIGKAVGTYTGGTSNLVREAYVKAVELDPNNPKVHIDLGQALYLIAAANKASSVASAEEIGKLSDQAKSEFEIAARLNPQNADATFGLVLVDELNDKKDEAFAKLKALAIAFPQSAGLQYELALRQHDRKDDAAAKVSLNAALTLDSTFAPAHVLLGKIAEGAGDTTAARSEYQKALQLDPSNQEAQTALDKLPKA